MDALTKAVSEVKYTIPPQILNLVFSKNGIRYANNPGALEAAIRDKVIDPRVRIDVDLIGAIQVEIPLDTPMVNPIVSSPSPDTYDRFTYVYTIPKVMTQNRRITSALAYSYSYNGNLGMSMSGSAAHSQLTQCGLGAMSDAVNAVSEAMAPIAINQTARVSIIGENVVLIEDYIPLPRQSFLRCLVSHDTEFSTIKPQTIPNFAQLVVLATKAYIYNVYRIELDRGFLQGGQELGSIRDVVDSYSDAEQMYQEFLKEKWRKISYMNDPSRMQRMAKRITGGKG
jgi:hypothetical protein